MASSTTICRIGVSYDCSFFAYAQHYYYHERDLGWLRFQPPHAFIAALAHKEQVSRPGISGPGAVYVNSALNGDRDHGQEKMLLRGDHPQAA